MGHQMLNKMSNEGEKNTSVTDGFAYSTGFSFGANGANAVPLQKTCEVVYDYTHPRLHYGVKMLIKTMQTELLLL